MIRILFAFIFAFFSTIANAGLFDGKYSQNQVFDVARGGSCGTTGGSCYVYNFINPFYAPYTNWTHVTWAAGDYVKFYDAGSGQVGMKQFDSGGNYKATISNSGYVQALGDGILYIGVPNVQGGTGYFISNSQGYSYGDSATFTVQKANPTATDLANYKASTTPLAAGQTASLGPPKTPGFNYITYAAGGSRPSRTGLTQLSTGTASTVNYDWGGGQVLDSGRVDGVVVKFTGTFTPTYTGTYQFGTTSDDGTVLIINGVTVVDAWQEQGPTFYSGSVNLTAGQDVSITLWYYENGGGAMVQLWWFNPSTGSWEIVPSSMVSVPTVTEVSTSTTNSVSTSSSSSSTNTNSVSVNTTTNTNNTISTTTDTYIGTTTTTTTVTTTTPVTTTTYSDGSSTSTNGNSTTSTSTSTTYTINSTLGIAPIYSADSPNTAGNSVYIKQTSAWANTDVNVRQDGNNNAVTGIQSGWATVDGNGSNINIKQYGNGNIVGVNMNAWGNYADINQGNSSKDVSNNITMFDSHGNGNSIGINQLSNSNYANVKITYDINTINLTQQTGTLNKSYITINGNWNTVNNTQSGNGNFALINIAGDQNTASVYQTGNNHSALINLIGDKNNVSLTQTGAGDTYSLQQTCNNPAGCSLSIVRSK